MNSEIKYLNIGCGPHRARAPWWNIDVVENSKVRPDEVVTERLGYYFSNVSRVYLGHVLEHIHWNDVADFLYEVRAIMAPGGELAVVGPDVLKTIQRYKDNKEPWNMVLATLEDQSTQFMVDGKDASWEGATHKWNCNEQRVIEALADVGFTQVSGMEHDDPRLDDYPVVSRVQWQCFVWAQK